MAKHPRSFKGERRKKELERKRKQDSKRDERQQRKRGSDLRLAPRRDPEKDPDLET